MSTILEHPEVEWALRTGYPSWMQEGDTKEEFDADTAYEDRRDGYGW